MNKELLLASVMHEYENLRPDWEIRVVLDMGSLMTVVGALQLAMRRPQFKKRPSGAAVRRIIDTLIKGIPEDMPAARELVRLGDNPKFDNE